MEGEAVHFGTVARRHGVELLVQYGSTITGHLHPRSDVDVAALFASPSPSLARQSALMRDLQGAFPGSEVDLAVLNRADPLFLARVLEHCRLLAGSSRRLAELKMYAFRRYQDHRPFLRMEERHLRRFTAERAGR